MSHESYLEKVKHIIAEQLKIDIENIKEDARLVEDLQMDSLHLVRLSMAIENLFNIDRFQVDEHFIVKTVGQAAYQIEQALANKILKTEISDPSAKDYDSPIL
jgi:acyl carrier protein